MGAKDVLARALEVVGGSQAELARRIGRSDATVSRWVAGRSGIDFDSALRLAKLTGLSPREVVQACGLDADLVPLEHSQPNTDPVMAELDRRLAKLAATLSQYPRAFWLAVVEASERMAEAGSAIGEAPVSGSGTRGISPRGRTRKRGSDDEDEALADRSHGLIPSPAFG